MEHATRMIVIPEDFYNSLMSQRNLNNENPLDTHLSTALNKMDKIVNTPSLNDTERYALYNSQLKKLKNLKTEHQDRSPRMNVNVKSAPETNQSIREIKETLEKFLKQNEHNRTDSTYSNSSYASLNDDEMDALSLSTSISKTPSKRSNPKRNANKLEKASRANEANDKLYDFIMQNKEKFGVDDQGRILDSKNQPVKNSNIRDTAKRLLDDKISSSPPGTSKIRTRMTSDAGAKNFIDLIKSSINQSGKGIKIKKQNKNNQKLINASFKPIIWQIPRTF